MKASNSSIAQIIVLIGLLTVALCISLDHGKHGTTSIKQNPISASATTNSIVSLISYKFDVYCPIDCESRLAKINEFLGLKRPVIKINLRKNKNFYVVIAKAKPLDPTLKDSPAGLYYCGLARKSWETDCDNAEIVCSIPGPIFRFQRKEKATIMWINDIFSSTVNWQPTECYSPDSDNHFCTVAKKAISDQCTYYKPTEYLYKTLNHRITQSSIPISPHIHGLEVRPTFDGNPLAWFNTAGDKGPGFNTILNQKYYALFKNPITLDGLVSIDPEISKRSRILQAPNDQNPGLLIYHDHPMKSTRFNVQKGLIGLYIIQDKKVEAKLPKGANQKLIVFAKQGDARLLVSQSDAMDKGHSLNSKLYRVRMVNAHVDDIFYNITFSAYYTTAKQTDGSSTYTELDPLSSATYDLTANQHKISFTVIGTDTSLFSDPISGVEQVTLGSAERVDILIHFRKSLPAGIKFIYLVCFDNNEGKYVVKHRFSVAQDVKTGTHYYPAYKIKRSHHKAGWWKEEQSSDCDQSQKNKKLKLKVPFVDLTKVSDKEIAVKRHRPLFSLPRDMNFMIGAHYMFEEGASQNPQIGSIEDFYIVNNLWEAHPIHIHLINFQVVRSYSLKQLPQNTECTFYMLDFFRNSGLPQFQKNNVELCTYIWSLEHKQVHQIFHKLKNYMREDVIGADRNNGLNTLTPYDGNAEYLVAGCEFNTVYKYVCADTTKDVDPYLRRWKDTSLVPPFTVYVFRMRWASNSYDPKVKRYPYFAVPEDQLIEFPGFVYHCHILIHQDNEMMRPIMLSHSDRYLQKQKKWKSKSTCSLPTWLQSLKCINKKGGCLL